MSETIACCEPGTFATCTACSLSSSFSLFPSKRIYVVVRDESFPTPNSKHRDLSNSENNYALLMRASKVVIQLSSLPSRLSLHIDPWRLPRPQPQASLAASALVATLLWRYFEHFEWRVMKWPHPKTFETRRTYCRHSVLPSPLSGRSPHMKNFSFK